MISNFVKLFDLGSQSAINRMDVGILRYSPPVSKRLGQFVALRTPVNTQAALMQTGPSALFARKV